MGDNVTPVNFEEELPHTFSEVVCLKCLKRSISVRPVGTLLKNLECETCGPGFIIETGEVMEHHAQEGGR